MVFIIYVSLCLLACSHCFMQVNAQMRGTERMLDVHSDVVGNGEHGVVTNSIIGFPFRDAACFIEEYAGLIGGMYDTEEFDRSKARGIISEFLRPIGMQDEVATMLYLSMRELVPILALDTVSDSVFDMFDARLLELCGGAESNERRLNVVMEEKEEEEKTVEPLDNAKQPESIDKSMEKINDALPNTASHRMRRLQTYEYYGTEETSSSDGVEDDYTSDWSTDSSAEELFEEDSDYQTWEDVDELWNSENVEEELSEEASVKEDTEEAEEWISMDDNETDEFGYFETEEMKKEEAFHQIGVEEQEKIEEAVPLVFDELKDITLTEDHIDKNKYISSVNADSLKALYDQLRSVGDTNVQAYLDSSIGKDFSLANKKNILSREASGTEGRVALFRENVEGECYFLSNVSRYCFIVEYAGFLGASWGSRDFDEEKARFILDSILTSSFLVDTTASIMCEEAGTIMPLFAGDETITPEAIRQFMSYVETTCSLL